MEFAADEVNYPVRSVDVLTTIAFIEVGFGDEVEIKF
jgi:hypothetical protein